MKSRILLVLCVLALLIKPVFAAQSTITEAEGKACMGDDKSRKQTEHAALADAKKMAVEHVSTFLKSESEARNFVLERDVIAAYARAEVKLIGELSRDWYKDPNSGDCLKLRIKAEVIPDTAAMEKMAKQDAAASEDPSAPLNVKVWTDKKDYKENEKIKLYIRGNKPFYARVLYKDASGDTLQLLPNPYRTDNYFNGGSIYEIPSGNDGFELEVSPPFGEENIIVYAGTAPLGEIDVRAQGAVYQVKTNPGEVAVRTRGVKIAGKASGSPAAAAEFFEDTVRVTTGGK
jgi:hypothetical protein